MFKSLQTDAKLQFRRHPCHVGTTAIQQKATGRGAINETLQIVYMLEFKRSTDRYLGFPEAQSKKPAVEANEQHKNIIRALRLVTEQLLRSGNLRRLTLW